MSTSRRIEKAQRRETLTVTWSEQIGGVEHELSVGFGWNLAGRIDEVFCSGHKEGSNLRATLTDACILLSYCLQYGASILELAQAMGEDRGEGMRRGPPASLIGAIARRGAMLERGATTYLCPHTDEICSLLRGQAECDCDVKGRVK